MLDPNIELKPSRLAIEKLRSKNLDMSDAIYVAQTGPTTWDGTRSRQTWHQGETPGGITINVLVQRYEPLSLMSGLVIDVSEPNERR